MSFCEATTPIGSVDVVFEMSVVALTEVGPVGMEDGDCDGEAGIVACD